MFSAAELTELYAETGDAVTLTGESTPRFGHFSEAGQEVLGGDVITAEPTLRFCVADFPAMPRHTQLTVSGRTWRTRTEPQRIADGREAQVALELRP